MKEKEKILICGAGQGGHAMSAYATIKGYSVVLYTHTPKKAEIIKNKNNKISVSGIYNEDVTLDVVTTDLESYTKSIENIILVSDATAHKYFAEKMAPYLSNQNILLISPGVGGALSFYNQVLEKNSAAKITVAETDTLMYACKVPEIGSVHIKTEKKEILYASVPNSNKKFNSIIKNLYPYFQEVENPLMGLDDSPVFHIVGMIKNSSRILNRENFNFYIDGITPEIAEYMEKMDAERCAVTRELGIKPRSVKEWLFNAYGVKKDTLYNMIQNTPPYKNSKENSNRSPAPKTLFHRYLMEEIPLRAVPTVYIARKLNIKVPHYEEMINAANELTGIDFWKAGRRIEDMGLARKDIKNIKYLDRIC